MVRPQACPPRRLGHHPFKLEAPRKLGSRPPGLHPNPGIGNRLCPPHPGTLGRLADAVVFIARAGHTTRDAALAAHQRLAEDGINVLGTILNDWNPKRSSKGYYGYHHGSYYGGRKYSGYDGYYSRT